MGNKPARASAPPVVASPIRHDVPDYGMPGELKNAYAKIATLEANIIKYDAHVSDQDQLIQRLVSMIPQNEATKNAILESRASAHFMFLDSLGAIGS